jgi:hypothetical protein
MTKQVRLTGAAVSAAMAVSVLIPTAASAGKEGQRNTAYALGAVAAYGVIKKKPEIAGLAGAGAVYSFVRSQKSSSRPKAKKVVHVHHRHCGCKHKRKVVHHVHRHHKGCGHKVVHVHRTPPGWSKGRKVGWKKHDD